MLRPITFSKAKSCKCYRVGVLTWENLWRTQMSNTWFICSSSFYRGKKDYFKNAPISGGKRERWNSFSIPVQLIFLRKFCHCFTTVPSTKGCCWATGYSLFNASEHMDKIQDLFAALRAKCSSVCENSRLEETHRMTR